MQNKIIVCYHKLFEIFQNEVLLPLHVGKSNSAVELNNIIGDNTGDNISDKNTSYCELTGLYWLWKNIDADNYGLFHYRRLLDLNNKYKRPFYPSKLDLEDWNSANIDREMSQYDIILPKKSSFKLNVYDYYKRDHIIKDLDIILDIIKQDYPQYVSASEITMKQYDAYFCNMFIMKKSIFHEYCSWLFDILGKAEHRINWQDRDSYQIRVFGFLAERMLNIFINYKLQTDKQIKIREVNTLMLEDEPISKFNFIIGEYINFLQKIYVRFLNIRYTRKKRGV